MLESQQPGEGQKPAPLRHSADYARRLLSDRVGIGVSRYQDGDHDELKAFVEAQFGPGSPQADNDFFTWRFLRHPYRPASGPEMWVCRREGAIVGQQAGLPFVLDVRGRPAQAVWSIDLMVDPKWRLRGVGPALMNKSQGGRLLVAGLGFSTQAHRACVRAGWVDLGRTPRYVRLLRPLRAGDAPTGRRAIGRYAALATHVATPLLNGMDSVTAGLIRLAELRLVPIAHFDERVNAVWAAAARHHPLAARRDLAFLSWRFDAAPHAAQYRRYYLTRGDAVLGYAVMRREGEGMAVVDFLCEPKWERALFANCLGEARRAGALALSCLATRPGTRKCLSTLGFLGRSGPRFMLYPDADHTNLDETGLGVADNWFLTEADSDVDHHL